MKPANHVNFLSLLSSDEVTYIYHHPQNKKPTKLGKILEGLDAPNVFEFINNENDKNLELCENLEIAADDEMIYAYKGGNMYKYKDKGFSTAAVTKFINAKPRPKM